MARQRPVLGARQGEPRAELRPEQGHHDHQACQREGRDRLDLEQSCHHRVPRLSGCAMSLLKILHQEDINFLLTNRIPRRLATRWIGWLSKIENPAGGAGVDRDLAAVRRSRSQRCPAAILQKPACLLHAGAEARRASGRCRCPRAGKPVRRHRRRLRHGRGHRAAAGQGLSLHAAATCWPIRPWSRPIAAAPTSRCGSPRACTTASMRRMTARSSG